jgi:hypothetical protein
MPIDTKRAESIRLITKKGIMGKKPPEFSTSALVVRPSSSTIVVDNYYTHTEEMG